MQTTPLVLSLDGNIGAGKTTLREALKDADGRSLLELFYEDKRRWAYTCAILTRLRSLRKALASTRSDRF